MGRVFCMAALALVLCVSAPGARLLDGYYQVTGVVITYDGDDRPRGFNNTGLYIVADERRVRVAGAWRGFPVRRDMVVHQVVGDTLVLMDAENPAYVYKFHIRNNIVSGRHAMSYHDGTRQVINTRATVRQLNRMEVDRLRSIIDF